MIIITNDTTVILLSAYIEGRRTAWESFGKTSNWIICKWKLDADLIFNKLTVVKVHVGDTNMAKIPFA